MGNKKRKQKKTSDKISKNIPDIKITDASLSSENGFVNINKKSMFPKVLPSPSKVYTTNIGRGRVHQFRWEPPEWDFAQTGRIIDSVSGNRFTAVKLDGNLLIVSFSELWDILSKNLDIKEQIDREYIYPNNLEVLSGELEQAPNSSISKNKKRGERFCCVPECDKKHHANGYCSSHFDQIRKNPDKELPPVINGVWKKCNYLTRHKVSKSGFHFLQKHGNTEITADHSLITVKNNKLEEFKPKEQLQVARITNFSNLIEQNKTTLDLSEFFDFETNPDITVDSSFIYYKKKHFLSNGGYQIHECKIPRILKDENLKSFLSILGAYISEGSVKLNKNGEYVNFRIAQKDPLWLKDLEKNFNLIFPDLKTNIIDSSGTSILYCSRKLIALLFGTIGGYRSENKQIPNFIYNLKKDFQDVFKKYMIDGDGSRYKWGYTYTTKSLKLASGWSFLLSTNNINSSFGYKIKKDKTIYYGIKTNNNFENRTQYKTHLIPIEYKEEYVYDLEVEDTHNFVDLAGQILLHNTESIVRRAFRVKKNLFLKEGYEISGPDINRTRYIKRRFQQMEMASGIPFPILMSQTVASLISCQNAFWVKKRDENASGGKIRYIGLKKLKPVAAYFPVAVEDIRFKRDEHGKILKYEQNIRGKNPVEFNPEDIIHFYLDKRNGFSVGTPILTPVADDIRALRRIEENVELLVYQHLFPLFHYQIGTPDSPAAVFPDGSTEVDVVTVKVAQMPSDGCWVTPERHKVTPLQAGQSPVAVEKVMEHFKKRIYIGLGVSSVDMGEGDTANNSTAQTMSRNLVDDTKADQKELGAQFYSEVIVELLLESTFPENTLLDEENRVYLKFKEIDNETRQAKENHVVDMFLKNAITHSEMRIQLGYEPFMGEAWPTSKDKKTMFVAGDGDFAGTNYGLFERDKIILQSVDEPGTDAAKQNASNKSSSSTSAGGKSVQNKNKPQNQHGTRPSAKLNKDSFEPIPHIPSLDYIFVRNPPLETTYWSIKNKIADTVMSGGIRMKSIDFSISSAFSEAKNDLLEIAKQAYRIGLRDKGHFSWEVNIENIDQRIQKHVEKYIIKFKDELLNRIEYYTSRDINMRYEDSIIIKSVFDVMGHRIRMIDKSEILRAYNYGLASGCRLDSFEEMRSVSHSKDSCDICKTEFLKYTNTDVIIYEELPPLHPMCTCTMEVTK